jgi:hypothetical protein
LKRWRVSRFLASVRFPTDAAVNQAYASFITGSGPAPGVGG